MKPLVASASLEALTTLRSIFQEVQRDSDCGKIRV